MKTRFAVFLLGGVLAAVGPAVPRAAGAILYGATGTGSGTGTLVTIDPATGAYTVVGPLNDASGNNYRITGLAVHPTTGVLYGSSNNQSPTNPRSLVMIDPLTALVTLVGSYGTPSQTMADLTFSSLGVLYGWLEASDDDLYTINPVTGAAALVGESGLSTYGSGLAADSSGTLYFAGDGTGGTLWTINPATGAPTPGPTLGNGPGNSGDPVAALAFSPLGVLYGVVGSFGGTAYLVTIDPLTGGITTIGQTIDRLDAIAFTPGASEIPEPSSLSLLLLGGLALAGLRKWR